VQTKLLFMEIQNIHAVRASADSLQALCEDPSDQKWLSRLEATGWLNHVQSIMSAACSLARKMDHQRLSCVVYAYRIRVFNLTPMGVNSISFGSPRVRCTPMRALSTCGEPDEIKKNTPPKSITGLFREQALQRRVGPDGAAHQPVYAARAVQFHPHGGQIGFVWAPRTYDVPPWGVRVVKPDEIKKNTHPEKKLPLFFVIEQAR